MASSLTIGPLWLASAPGRQLLSLWDDVDGRVERFVASSPDRTVYHSKAYLAFAREERPGLGDLVVVCSDGKPLFGLPVYPESNASFTTGYSGILFPAGGDRVVKRGVAALFEWLSLNTQLTGAHVTQAVVSDGGVDDARRALIDLMLTSAAPPHAVSPLFTRVLSLAPSEDDSRTIAPAGELAPSELDESLMKGYEADLRNQIRQAVRKGLRVRYYVLRYEDVMLAAHVYPRYLPVHEESWTRTGMPPHSLSYWRRLSAAVTGAGGIDLVVLVEDGSGPVAGVTCHVRDKQAIYWSGSSTSAGLLARANPLALHAAISLCRRLGVRSFELGRFVATEDEKSQRITHYKAQFGGTVTRMPNFKIAPQPSKTERMVTNVKRELAARYPRPVALATRVLQAARAYRAR